MNPRRWGARTSCTAAGGARPRIRAHGHPGKCARNSHCAVPEDAGVVAAAPAVVFPRRGAAFLGPIAEAAPADAFQLLEIQLLAGP